MKERRNEGGKQQREGCTLGLTGLNLPLPPKFPNRASKGDFIGVFVCSKPNEQPSIRPQHHDNTWILYRSCEIRRRVSQYMSLRSSSWLAVIT